MRDLIKSLDPELATVVMLKFGFAEVDSLRVNHGFKPGQALSDKKIGLVLGVGETAARNKRFRAMELLQGMKEQVYEYQ